MGTQTNIQRQQVESLIAKASDAKSADDALKFSQAA